MKSRTLVAVGIGIGLGLMALIGGGESQASGPQAPVARHPTHEELQHLLARMGHDAQALDPEELNALVELFSTQTSGMARHNQRATASMDSMGQGFSAEDLLLLQGFVQVFGAQGYAGHGSLGSTGYAGQRGGGSLGYGQLGYGGGDNYYSSRVGTGNYNADNSAGYVYIPGTGSVSYGM